MRCFVGIDIGAVSATAAVIVDEADTSLRADDTFELLPRADGAPDSRDIYLAGYRRTRGQPITAANELLSEIVRFVSSDNIVGICLTGSGSAAAAEKLQVETVNEFRALASGLSAVGVDVRTVFEMGGESSKYLRLTSGDDGLSIVDYATNGDCAAGTGSFIDQQCGRLRYEVEDISDIIDSAERAAQVAGRCSVFAKSDMIHAQQKGYTPPEVLRGLCNAVARNFRTAVVRSHPVEAPVAFVGGVAANRAVVAALREAFELDEHELFVPPAHSHLSAIGAAVAACENSDEAILSHIADLRHASDTSKGQFPRTAKLNMDSVVLLRDRVEPYVHEQATPVDAYMGIDIGSVSTNVVVIEGGGKVVAEIYTRTKGRPIEVVSEALKEIEADWGNRLHIRGVGTTGSGRELIGELIGADTINDEITAHKTGSTYVGQTLLGGRLPDTIFEIGGQDSKYISLENGIVVDFTMNEACAAGTGSFLEERAEELGIAIKGQFAEMALSSDEPIRLGERCTVFMERDVNSTMQHGADTADVVAGLAYSVVYNYINRVVRGRKIGDTIFFQGGTAYNDAVAAAFAAVTGKEIIVPPHNGVIGAIGVALLARDKMQAGAAVHDRSLGELEIAVEGDEGVYVSDRPDSNFRGYDMSRVDYTLREFECKGCSNTCQIQEFNVEGAKTYWGDKCSDKFRRQVKSSRKPVIDDLFALRERLLFDESFLPSVPGGAPTVGIPMTMFAWEQLPFWRTMFAHVGFATVLSEPTNKRIVQAGLDNVVAEPCFPIIVAHGHVAALAEQEVDHILLPNMVSLKGPDPENHSFVCPWHQTLPFVCRRAPGLKPTADKYFTPIIRFQDGPKDVARELRKLLKPLGVSTRRLAAAVAAGYEAQAAFDQRLIEAGNVALKQIDDAGDTGIVLVGRPYNIHDAGVNLSVARKLRDHYGVNVIPMDCLDTADDDIADINPNMYWELGRRIIAAARIVGQRPSLHIIYITNFKCGPDSYIKHFVRTASGKPYLTLQLDGHSNDAGMMTRCEAYLDSKGILRPWRQDAPAETQSRPAAPVKD